MGRLREIRKLLLHGEEEKKPRRSSANVLRKVGISAHGKELQMRAKLLGDGKSACMPMAVLLLLGLLPVLLVPLSAATPSGGSSDGPGMLLLTKLLLLGLAMAEMRGPGAASCMQRYVVRSNLYERRAMRRTVRHRL